MSITTDYGNVMDGLKYTAVSDMFYEFSGIAYSPLTEEQAASVCEMIGIMEWKRTLIYRMPGFLPCLGSHD